MLLDITYSFGMVSLRIEIYAYQKKNRDLCHMDSCLVLSAVFFLGF